jgi:hypothetical protein
MWVSTGRDGFPREKSSTHLAVLCPTPGRRIRYSSASDMFIDLRESRLMRPCSFSICSSTCLILTALIWDSPPDLMTRAICSAGAEATASQLSKLALREAKALPEFVSDVFWDSMVPMSTSIGSLSGCHLRGPYSCSKNSMTSPIATGSKISCRCLLMQRCPLPSP